MLCTEHKYSKYTKTSNKGMSTANLQGLDSLQLGYQVVPIVLHVVALLPQVVPVQLHLVEIMLLLLNLPGLASLQFMLPELVH